MNKFRQKMKVVFSDLNGNKKIGTVTDIKPKVITVQCPNGKIKIKKENAAPLNLEKTIAAIAKER